MWPWGHAALGYLIYTAYGQVRGIGQPSGWPVVALAVGTQFPDLVDKPLAWNVHLLPYGRTLTHSLLVAVPLSLAVTRYAAGRDRRAVGVAFAIGYLSHLLGDAFGLVVYGDYADLAFLVWPLLPIPDAEDELEGFLAHFQNIQAEPLFVFGLLLTAAALLLWHRHGYPGLRELFAPLTRRR